MVAGAAIATQRQADRCDGDRRGVPGDKRMTLSTQRAATLLQPMTTRVRDVELLQPVGKQVRVRLQGCGICASNLPVWEGRPWFTYPMAAGSPGHEGWGIVDALGEQVRDLEV